MPFKDILIVEDDPLVCRSLKEMLALEGYAVEAAASGPEALERLRHQRYHLVLSDIRLPGMNGLELFKELAGLAPETAVVFITGHGHIEGAVKAIKLGAYDYLTKPLDDLRLKVTLKRALEQQKLKASYSSLKRRFQPWEGEEVFISRDRSVQELLGLVDAVAGTMATVLVAGESGTGKSLLARYIHQHSLRARGPFVAISCGSLTETLLESELFGHVRGAFTGALKDKKGKLEEAQGGTIFLDDINCASPSLQVKLLGVLQDRVVERVGSNAPFKVDARFVAAANTPLLEEVRQGRFREDLYYRLNVISFPLPPLRARMGDIPPLIEHLIMRFNQLHGRQVQGIAKSALQLCLKYPWPGNVRELENVVERAVLLTPGNFIGPRSLPTNIREGSLAGGPAGDLSLAQALKRAERQILLEVLERHRFSRQASARALGLSRTTLFYKMRRLKITPPPRGA